MTLLALLVTYKKALKMDILFFTVKGTGHNLFYFKVFLSYLTKKTLNSNIIVALPSSCLNSESYLSNIKPYETNIQLVIHNGVKQSSPLKNSWQECHLLKDCITKSKLKPQIVLSPNGNQIPYLWPIFSKLYFFNFLEIESFYFALLGVGISCYKQPFKKGLASHVKKLLLAMNTKGSLKTIDAYGFDCLQKENSILKKVFSLVPDPMDNIELHNKSYAREYFNIPDKAFIISISGAMDSHPRKNAKLLIDAIGHHLINQQVVLVIAGKLSDEINKYLMTSQVKKEGRLIVIDKYLSDQEITLVTQASDCVCTPYSEHYSPSGIVLRAIKCQVPVIVPNYHWFKYMVEEFGIGWTIPSLTLDDLIVTVNKAYLEMNHHYTYPRNSQYLNTYFSETNFLAHWLENINKQEIKKYSFTELLVDFNNGH